MRHSSTRYLLFFALPAYVLMALIQTPDVLTGNFAWDERFSEYIPWRVELGRLLASGESPFFTDRVFGGMPVLALSYVGALYPPNWLYAVSPVYLANFLAFSHTLLGALGMMLYLRSRRLTNAAAFGGGLIFICCTFMLIRFTHLSMREVATLAPWVAWFAHRLLRRPNSGRCAALALALAVQIAAGCLQIVLMTVCWVALDWLTFARWKRRFARQSAWLALAVILGVGLMGLQICLSLEHVKETLRATMSMEDWRDTPFHPKYALIFFAPRAWGTLARGWPEDSLGVELWTTISSSGWGFAVTALVLCLCSARIRRGPRFRCVIGFSLGIALAFLLALGEHFPPNTLLFLVPPLNIFRIPARWLFLVCCLASALAATGIHLLSGLRWWKRPLVYLGCWLAWGLLCCAVFMLSNPAYDSLGEAWRNLPEVVFKKSGAVMWNGWCELTHPEMTFWFMKHDLGFRWIAAFLDRKDLFLWLVIAAGVAVLLPRRSPLAFSCLFLLLCAVNCWVLATYAWIPSSPLERSFDYRKHPLLKDYPREKIGRIYSPTPRAQPGEHALVGGNTHLFLGLSSLGGYCPILSALLPNGPCVSQTGVSWRDETFYSNPAPLEMFGVSHILVKEGSLRPEVADAYNARQGRLFETVHRAGQNAIVRLLRAPPRFDLARKWLAIKEPAEARELMWQEEPAVGERPALLEDARRRLLPPEGLDLPAGEVKVLEARGSYQRVSVRTEGKGVLLIRDVYWPGWEYRIEGQGNRFQKVRRANGGIRYAPVPGGEVTVELRYRPPGWKKGLRISLAALCAWVAVIAFPLWKSTRFGAIALSRLLAAGRFLGDPRGPLSRVKLRAVESIAIALAGALYAASALMNGMTYDEPAHLNAGIACLNDGTPDLDPAHPPLRAIYALPALFLRTPSPKHFLDPFPTNLSAAILVGGRLVALGLFLLGCWIFGRVAGRWLGRGAGFAALLLALYSPTLGAHAYLATTDVLFTMATFGLTAALFEWLKKPGWVKASLLGALAAVALLAKFTGLLWCAILAFALLLYMGLRTAALVRRGRLCEMRGRSVGLGLQLVFSGVLALFLVGAAYRFEGVGRPLGAMSFRAGGLAPKVGFLSWLPSPLPAAYLTSLDFILDWSRMRSAYFHGEMRLRGNFLLYFPALILMKPPLFLHLLLLMGVAGFVRKRPWSAGLALLALPPALFLVYATFASGVQIGVRHVLPVFPFLFLAAAWAGTAARARWWRLLSIALITGFVLTGAAATPHHLAYFNCIAGGRENAWRWFCDSNQDWGQGWPFIVECQQRHKRTLHFDPVEGETTGWATVSTNQLVGLSPEGHRRMRWLREDMKRRRFIAPCWHVYKIPKNYWETAETREPERPLEEREE
ncbi:MAG TPA: hypothetical protein VM492_14445 [Sumerlaeia bacterium]|nr:hypothetical protein [Sumerlaeia bacterium]